MTGHDRRRGERSWELKYDVGSDAKGRRKTRYASFKGTKREAEIELARLVSQNADGDGIDPSRATVTDFLDRWERDWATTNVGLKTLERYQQLLRLYVRPHIGLLRLQRLQAVHLNELYSGLLRSGEGTIVRCHRDPSAMCTEFCTAHLVMPPHGALFPRMSPRWSARLRCQIRKS